MLPTDLAALWLATAFERKGVSATEAQAREAIYRWAKLGQVTNYGTHRRGGARWLLAELRAQVWPRGMPYPEPLDKPVPDAPP